MEIFFKNVYSLVLHYENVLGGKQNDPKQILNTKGPQKPLSMVLKPVKAQDFWELDPRKNTEQCEPRQRPTAVHKQERQTT